MPHAATVMIETTAAWAWDASWHAAAAVLVVLIVRGLAGRWLSPGWRCALWGLVALRLVLPQAPRGDWSLFNAIDRWRAPGAAGVSAMTEGVTAPAGPHMTVGFGPAPSTPDLVVTGTNPIAPSTLPDTTPLLPIVWLAGVLLMLARTAVGRARLRRALAPAVPIDDPAVRALLERCRRRMSVRRPVRLLATDAVTGPALGGLLRPAILLPNGLVDRLSPQQLAFVFLHELAHARRADVLAEWAIAVLTAIHWFNPLVWLAVRLYRTDREMARDAMVLRGSAASESRAYGDTLLQLIESFPPRRTATNLLGILSGRRALAQRIHRIASFDPAPGRRRVAALLGLALFVAVGCSTLTNPRKADLNAPAATGPGADDDDGPAGETVTRVYDVRDLIAPINDFDSDDAAAPAGTPKRPPATADGNLALLLNLIRETVEPASWGDVRTATGPQAPDAAGPIDPARPGALRERSGQLIVSQTRRAHAQLVRLLDQLREARSIQIVTQTRFVVFDPAALPKDDPAFAPVLALAVARRPADDAKPAPAPACLTPAQTTALLDAIASQKDSATLACPTITTFNGQHAYVKLATLRAYVSDLKILRDERGKTKAYEPEVNVAESGLTVDVHAVASADRKYLTLTVRPKLAKLVRMHTLPFPNVPADHPAGVDRPTVQRPEMITHAARVTASMPDGQTLVLGGGEDAGLLAPDDPNFQPKPGHRMYILVTPRLTRTAATQRSLPLLNRGKGN